MTYNFTIIISNNKSMLIITNINDTNRQPLLEKLEREYPDLRWGCGGQKPKEYNSGNIKEVCIESSILLTCSSNYGWYGSMIEFKDYDYITADEYLSNTNNNTTDTELKEGDEVWVGDTEEQINREVNKRIFIHRDKNGINICVRDVYNEDYINYGGEYYDFYSWKYVKKVQPKQSYTYDLTPEQKIKVDEYITNL